jgi:hypothetical protein
VAGRERQGDPVGRTHRTGNRDTPKFRPQHSAAREQKGRRTSRLLEAWHSDPKYLDGSGKPRDLSERDQEPSFFSLAMACVPGTSPAIVLEELRRAGLVQMLSEHRVRVRNRAVRMQGVNTGGVTELGSRGRQLLETLAHNLRRPEARLFCDSMPSIEVDATRVPFVRDLIAGRAGNFLAAIEQELAVEARGSRRPGAAPRARVGLTVMETAR